MQCQPNPDLYGSLIADEALRSGPKWNKTLFLVIYDDAGEWVATAPTGIPSLTFRTDPTTRDVL